MKKQILVAGICLMALFSCAAKDANRPADTTHRVSLSPEKALIRLPVESTEFFAVYTLSPKTTGLVMEIIDNPAPTRADSIFSAIAEKEHLHPFAVTPCTTCTIADSSGPFLLMKNPALEKAIRQQWAGVFYLYGTTGMRKITYQEVFYALDECITNLIICTIRPEDTAGIGQPLLAASRPLPLSYDSSYTTIDQRIRQQQARQPGDYSHMDTVAARTFARLDSFYFTYTDNFTIPDLQNAQRFRFPSRAVFKSHLPDSLHLYWSNSLDLFGIPCD
ncbi:hypothetical protein LL912_12150 [Niabella sp. CC-SYL272]|uniref:hypothetical protein n=1 Tax=Niabella agricola TaxID=2891571 RepID=UPI001F2B2A8B|nr:hypothetical protein [Niabella agricola]MCF3109525.1 hypothetical protein [Niabella agricola]